MNDTWKTVILMVLVAIFSLASYYGGYYDGLSSDDLVIRFETDNNTNDALTKLAFAAQEISEHANMAIFKAEHCTTARNGTEIWCDKNNPEFLITD